MSSSSNRIGQPQPQAASGSGVGHSLGQVEGHMQGMQAAKSTGMGGGQAGAMPPGHAAMDQSKMRVKPDCGEDSYRGSGKLLGKVALVTGGGRQYLSARWPCQS
jgi:hypothetical protein